MEAGLTAARSADDQYILVDIVLWNLIPPNHDALRLGQEDVVLEFRGDKWSDILPRPP